MIIDFFENIIDLIMTFFIDDVFEHIIKQCKRKQAQKAVKDRIKSDTDKYIECIKDGE